MFKFNDQGFMPFMLMNEAGDDGGSGGEGDNAGESNDGGDAGDKDALITMDDLKSNAENNEGAGETEGGDKSGADASKEGKKEEVDKEKAERPEFIKEKFWDPEKGEVRLEELAKANSELEKKLGSGAGKVPEKPEEYTLEVSDELKTALFNGEDPSKDPVIQKLQEKLHEANVPQEVYSAVMDKALEAIVENQKENPIPTIDPKDEMKKLGDNAPAIVEDQMRFLSGMYNRGELSEDAAQEILILTETAAGINALQALRNHFGDNQKIPMNLAAGGGIKSGDELRAMMADKKYGTDAEYTAQVDNEYQKKYGTGRSGESQRSAL